MRWLEHLIPGRLGDKPGGTAPPRVPAAVSDKIPGATAAPRSVTAPTRRGPVAVPDGFTAPVKRHAIPPRPSDMLSGGPSLSDRAAHFMASFSFTAPTKAQLPSPGTPRFLAPGEAVQVAGYTISSGMFYIGDNHGGLKAGHKPPQGRAAYLVDPSLPVGQPLDKSNLGALGTWPSYFDISPDGRSSYLEWLANGRSDPGCLIGCVDLFLYGLEQRVFVDNTDAAEKGAILDEVRRLLTVYGQYGSLRKQFQDFLSELHARDFLGMSADAVARWVPDLEDDAEAIASTLQIALSTKLVAKCPVPTELALSAYLVIPDYRGGPERRITEGRCRKELISLVRIRLKAAYPSGITFKKVPHAKDRIRYRPASRHLSLESLPGAWIDPSQLDWTPLDTLCRQAYRDLSDYSRAVGATLSGRGSAEALSQLPDELFSEVSLDPLPDLRAWLSRLGPVTSVDGNELADRFTTIAASPAARIKKRKAIALILARLGYGMEPNPFSPLSTALSGDSVWLFRMDGLEAPEQVQNPEGPLLLMASFVILVVAALAKTGARPFAPQMLAEAIATPIGLDGSDVLRLNARAALLFELATVPVPKKKALFGLPTSHYAAAAMHILTTAAARRMSSTAQIQILEDVFGMLGQNKGLIYSAFHQQHGGFGSGMQASIPEASLVIDTALFARVRQDKTKVAAISAETPPLAKPSEAPLVLDAALIARVREDTARANAVLASVFEEIPTPAVAAPVEAPTDATPELTGPHPPFGIAGLDKAHGGFAAALMQKVTWTKADFDAEARRHGLFPDGATETVNDWYFGLFDEALVEDGDPVAINREPFLAAKL
jgi:hypothetical protein